MLTERDFVGHRSGSSTNPWAGAECHGGPERDRASGRVVSVNEEAQPGGKLADVAPARSSGSPVAIVMLITAPLFDLNLDPR
jgi:hypothetical protein